MTEAKKKEENQMNNMWHAELFGNQITRTFSDIFPTATEFRDEYNNSAIAGGVNASFDFEIEDEQVELIWALLYAKYGNSHIASTDENQFKYKVWSLIYQYAPTWIKKTELQVQIRALNIDDIAKSKAIYNHAFNPGTAPSTATLEELTTINEQNTAITKRSLGDSYAMLISLLDEDVTEEFINKFKKLFLQFVAPAVPLWYVSEGE